MCRHGPVLILILEVKVEIQHTCPQCAVEVVWGCECSFPCHFAQEVLLHTRGKRRGEQDARSLQTQKSLVVVVVVVAVVVAVVVVMVIWSED